MVIVAKDYANNVINHILSITWNQLTPTNVKFKNFFFFGVGAI